MNKFNYISLGKGLLLGGWLALFIGGIIQYSGTWWIYAIFSIVFALLLLSGFYRQVTYGYLFVTIFFWLGFWLKVTWHLMFDYEYIEPIGGFSGSAESWDQALVVASVACLGIILARALLFRIKLGSTIYGGGSGPEVPTWYVKTRKWLWIVLLSSIVTLAMLNSTFGIQQSGLVSRTILIWPLNAVIYWILSIGGAMGVATLAWWEFKYRKSNQKLVIAILLEALISSIALMSRAAVVFHALPQIFALYKNGAINIRLNVVKIMSGIVLVALVLLFSIAAVNTIRNYSYSDGVNFSTKRQEIYSRIEVINGTIPQVEAIIQKGDSLAVRKKSSDARFEKWLYEQGVPASEILAHLLEEKRLLKNEEKFEENKWVQAVESPVWPINMLAEEFTYQAAHSFDRISRLAIDRWIGIEGVLAVSSFQNKEAGLIWEALIEKPAVGSVTMYQRISESPYQDMNATKFQFATLPGPSAFFYYGGALWMVALGMCAMTIFVLLTEIVVSRLTDNALLCALYGMDAANAMAQFGVAPRQLAIHFTMVAIGMAFIWMIQTKRFEKFVMVDIRSRNRA